jgi:septal ring factor EnvC (AmiA/AmiB activator)
MPAKPLALLVVMLAMSAPLQARTQDANEKREQLKNIRSQIQQTEQTLQQAKTQKQDIQSDLMQAEKEISYIGRRLHIIRKDYELQEKRWRELQAVKLSREEALDIEQQRLGELLRSAYKIDRHGDIRLILNQESPALFSRMMTYHDYFGRQRIAQIKRVNQRIEELEKAQHALQLQTRTLERLTYKQEQELAKLGRMKQQKQLALDDIRKSIDSEGKQLSQLRKDEQSLKNILKSLTDLLSDIPKSATSIKSFSQYKGELPWPSAGKIATRFGSARGDSGKRWSGVVISSQRGSEVIAVARGRVAFSDWLRGYGLLLIMDHGDGYMSLYGHNESVFKDTGEWVEPGEVIASVGDSGGQNRPGLYFEIRHDGKPVNPVKWCATSSPPRNG